MGNLWLSSEREWLQTQQAGDELWPKIPGPTNLQSMHIFQIFFLFNSNIKHQSHHSVVAKFGPLKAVCYLGIVTVAGRSSPGSGKVPLHEVQQFFWWARVL